MLADSSFVVDRTRSASWQDGGKRVALAMTGEEIEALTALSRSRTEPAGRVSRAAMLLGYREKPSFFAVGRRLGVHHQTVQRCVERAMAYGALAALDDRARPGKEATITPEAKAWLVSLACDKAKEHGYPHELWTTRLLARHARERGPAAKSPMSRCLAQGHRVQASRSRGNQAAQGALLSGTPRRRVRAQDGGSCNVSTARSRSWKKPLPRRRNRRSRSRSSLTTSSLRIQAIATTALDLPPVPGRHASFARDHEYKRHGTLQPVGRDRSAHRQGPRASSGSATAQRASSSNSSSFSMPPIRPAPRSS